jgi:hypothetical protein
MQVRCDRPQCGAKYAVTFDRLGRMAGACPACARRKAGYCATCPAPVDGPRGQAKYCAPCRVLAHRAHHQKYVNNDRARYNRMAAERIARKRARLRGGKPVMDQQTIGTLRGLARAKALSPERRREIAAQASKVRWQKYYQRQMLRKMQEASQ